jgi:hypothetical protein
LYPGDPPELILGRLEENEEVPLGVTPTGAFHCMFVGETGYGKTVAIHRLIAAIEERNQRCEQPIVVIVLDYKGGSYSGYPRLYGDHWRYFDVHGALRLGLQPPIGVPARVWINHLATCFCARAGLIAAWVTFANELRWLAAAMNPRNVNQPLFPDFQLLLDVARVLPKLTFSEKTQYLEALLQLLEGVVQASGALFRTFDGLDLDRDLVSQGLSAVISIPGLSPPWLNQFVADFLILQLLLGRTARNVRGNSPNVMLILDDCDAIVSRDNERQFLTSMPPIVHGLRVLRELRVGFGLGVGALSPVSERVLNSLSHLFVFRNPHDDCADAAKRSLGLPPGSQTLIQALEAGECVVRLPGPWSRACLGRIDEIVPRRDDDVEDDANLHVPAERLDEMPEVLRAIETLAAEHRRNRRRQAKIELTTLRQEARELLGLAVKHPSWPVARLYQLMGTPSPTVQKAVRCQLTEADYALMTDVRVGSKTLALIELAKAAWELLGEPEKRLPGRGKLAHRTFAYWIKMVGERRGYEAELESTVPGTTHAADAAWLVDGRWRVFEVVVTCEDNLEGHLRAALLTPESQVESVTIVAPQKATLEALKKQVALFQDFEFYRGRVHFLPVEAFERELWPK